VAPQLIKMARMQIIPGRVRRRSWSEEQKRAIVAAAFAPGAIVADVARRAPFCAGQMYRWRQAIRSAVPVVASTKWSSQRSMTEAVMRKMQCPSE
jgi:transposase